MSDSGPSTTSSEQRFHGTAASPGVATGPLVVYRPDDVVVRKRHISEEEIPAELARLEKALVDTRSQLTGIRDALAESLGEAESGIFDAHLLVVEDPTLLEGIRQQLYEKKLCVDYLYDRMTQSYVRKMRELDDSFLQERATDIVDVSRRVLRNLSGGHEDRSGMGFEEPSIIFAHDLTPSDTATLDRKRVLGFACEAGSRTSHTAIMARSLNIPAVVGLREISAELSAGCDVLVDGYDGILIINPSEQTKFEYGQIESRRHEVEVQLEGLRDTVAITNDQRHIIVSANVELPEDLPLVESNGAEGIGLFRSEFLFLNRNNFPSEEEQLDLYRQVAKAAGTHYSIVRTLDVGGDKMMSHLGIEEEVNPFLGWRGIRYTLGREDIFRTQLRAICRAGVDGNIRVMFPMVTEIAELREAKRILAEVREELSREGIPHADKIETGMMIEVPSAALTADLLASEVDFFSIGTNDLIQYTLAVDRGNERVSDLYEPTHPAVLRLIKTVVEAAHSHNIWVGVCGEMASDILLIPLLVGLGVDELSLGSVLIPRIKRVIQSLNYGISHDMANDLLNGVTAEENLEVLRELATRLYPELL